MSTTSTEQLPVSMTNGPSIRLRIAAIAVVLALGALAAYALFSGPTKVAVKAPSTAPTRVAPQAGEPDSESGGESRRD